MRIAFSLLVAFPALAVASDVVTVGMTGGWKAADVTDANTQLLAKALSGSSFSKAVGDTRVCYADVSSVETQVVAGTNYRFHIDGCGVTASDGECADSTLADCELGEFVVQIFEQSWSETLKVTSIKEVEAASSSSSEASGSSQASGSAEVQVLQTGTTQTSGGLKPAKLTENEKKAVDAWIRAKGLNQYGDEATRMYVGGTPLFDESTGESTDRYDYILKRHADRPWQAEMKTAKLFAAEEVEAQGGGSVAGVFAMLGVFTVVLAGVAVLKMHQGRRERFRYNPIQRREQ